MSNTTNTIKLLRNKFANIELKDNELIVENYRLLRDQNDRIVYLNDQKAKDFNLLPGDFIKLSLTKNNKTRELVCNVNIDSNIPCANIINTNINIRKNLRAKLGDKITFELFDEIDNEIDTINLIPFRDCVENMTGDVNDILRPYFANKNLKPFTVGEKITIKNSKKYEFKVISIKKKENGEEKEIKSGIYIANSTFTCLGEPIEREGDDDPNFVGYDDIGGYDKELELFRENVELPMLYPDLYTTIGVKPPKGVLLIGPPGTGKTLFAKAASYEIGVNYISISSIGCIQEIDVLFEKALENAPTIIFMDEIDGYTQDRDKNKDPNSAKISGHLLSRIDGMDSDKRIILIGATNRDNDIDSAFRRPGRFDQEIHINVPNEEGRLQILSIHTKNMKLDNDVSLEKLASETHGYVGADLTKLCRDAAVSCIKSNAVGVELHKAYNDINFMNSLYVSQKQFDETMKTIKPSSLRDTYVEFPKVSWDDIGGLEQVKKEFHDTLELPLLQPELFKEFGLPVFKGILMFGPPGCGKTKIAKAAANGCGANFISVKSPDIFDKFVGESESKIRKIFAKANAAAPCIIFFDEIDAITKPRGNSNDSGVSDRVLNQLLAEMDGFALRKDVFVIGATNRPDCIDPAILRPGRFDKLVYVPAPDEQSRYSILKSCLKNSPVDKNVEYMLQQIAKYTDGYSGADIESVAKNAIKNAMEEKLNKINESTKLNENTENDVSLVTKRHFEKAVNMSKKSINPTDMAKYEEMRKKYCNIEDPGEVKGGFKIVDADINDLASNF